MTSARTAPRSVGWGLVALLITFAIQAVATTCVIAPTAVAPAIAEAYGGVAPIGAFVALVYGGAMVSSVTGGWFVSRLGAVRTSQVSLLLCAAGLALIATSPWVAAAALGALLIGCGYGPITPASSDLLVRTTSPARMSFVFSVKQTGVPMGGVVAGAFTPSMTVAFGWPAALLALSAVTCACALAVQPLRAPLDVTTGPARPPSLGALLRPVQSVWRDRRLRTLAACSFVFSGMQVSLTVYLVTFLTSSLAWGLVAAGVALSVAQSAGVIGRPTWGWIADRRGGAVGTLAVLAVLMIASNLGMAMLTPQAPSWQVYVTVALYGATAIGWNGVLLAAVARLAPTPAQAGEATGGVLGYTYFGVMLGPPAFGLLARAQGYDVAFEVLAIPLALCAWGLVRARRSLAR